MDLRWSAAVGNGDLAEAVGEEVCSAELFNSNYLWITPPMIGVREVHLQHGCWLRQRVRGQKGSGASKLLDYFLR